MTTMTYLWRGFPIMFGELYRRLNRWTLAAVPLLGSFVVFWLVPGVPWYESIKSLRTGRQPEQVSKAQLVALWAFVPIVVVWVAWRRWFS